MMKKVRHDFYSLIFVLMSHVTNVNYVNIFLLVQGRILTVAGVTIAICSTPFVGFLNLVTLAVWPNWVVVATCETLRKVILYDFKNIGSFNRIQ